ncbi:MAG: FKBP-type peptidyl-prolyl cis-trans isomerase [Pseudomonadota bacterium]
MAADYSSSNDIDKNLIIQADKEVTLHFAVQLDSGEVLEDTEGLGKPAIFCIGDGQLPPSFENLLIGLSAGDQREFAVTPEQGFGEWRVENCQFFSKQMVMHSVTDETPLNIGLVVGFTDARGGEVPGVIRSFQGDLVEVDFNHPLAGRHLQFSVKIIDVQSKSQAIKWV